MIANYLAEKQAPTPSTYQSDAKAFNWAYSTVRSILSKQEYCGDTVNFRTERISYKNKKIRKNRPEDWVIFTDTHPAIVSREIFEKAQEIANAKKRIIQPDPAYAPSIFREVIFCADCGKRMYVMHKNGKHINSDSYICNTNRKNKALCSSHYIRESEIIKLVMLTAEKILQPTAYLGYSVGVRCDDFDEYYEIDRFIQGLFESKINGEIDSEMFCNLSRSYSDEKAELKSKIEILLEKNKHLKTDADRSVNLGTSVNKYDTISEVTSEILRDFVERIEIGDFTGKYSEKRKMRKIRIFFIGIGEFYME